MSLSIVIPPYGEAVSLPEMKNHLKQELSLTDDDALIISQTAAARDVIETQTGSNCPRQRTMLATTYDYAMDMFPFSSGAFMWGDIAWGCFDRCAYGSVQHIHVPRTPLISVTSISYVDTAGTTQTFSSSKYSIVEKNLGIIALAYNESWPSTRYQSNAVTVRFVSGMAAPFTAVASTDVCTVLGRTFSDGDCVHVLNSGGQLPGGLVKLTPYYVVSSSTNTFKLSATSGGSAIDITSTGSGTNYVGPDASMFETGRGAVKLTVGAWYRYREAFVLAPGMVSVELPMAVNALVSAIHA